MVKSTILLLSLFAFARLGSAEDQPVNFSGHWELDAQESGMQGAVLSEKPAPYVILHKSSEFQIRTSRVLETFNLDGKEKVEPMPASAPPPIKNDLQITKATLQQRSVKVIQEIRMENGQVRNCIEREWSLSDDGKTLTLSSIRCSSSSENSPPRILYFHKTDEKPDGALGQENPSLSSPSNRSLQEPGAIKSNNPSDLYHNAVNDKVNTINGKALVMALDEIERFDRFSIIRVSFTSGASVPRTMFVVRCLYEMAKLRKADYFINLKEWTDGKGNSIYKVGFSSDPSVDPSAYFGNDIDRNMPLRFLSVKDYDQLWDPVEKFRFMRKTAEEGNVGSQLALGSAYAEGKVVAQDYIQAYMWLTLAAINSGDQVEKAPSNARELLASQIARWQKEATDLCDSIAKKMTPWQVEEARKQAREWKPKQTK